MIPGVLGRKVGMTQLFETDGSLVGVTGVEAGPCAVVQVKTPEKDGYAAIQLGFGQAKRLNSPLKGHLKGLPNFRYLREFRVEDASAYQVGQTLSAADFQEGERVAITGISKGKGFAGGDQTGHGSWGLPRSHSA